jgi:hypothetical protein
MEGGFIPAQYVTEASAYDAYPLCVKRLARVAAAAIRISLGDIMQVGTIQG